MKFNILSLFLRRFALFCLFFVGLAVTAALQAQSTGTTPFHPGTTSSEVFNWYTGLYAAALSLLTYLQAAFFPKAGAVPKTAMRYVLIAAVLALLFITLGFANAWQVAIGFVTSALFYDKVLSPIGLKTPTPKE